MPLLLTLASVLVTAARPGAPVVPAIRATSSPVVLASAPTQLGGVIHFPSKLSDSSWPDAIAALDRLKATLGDGAYVRWDQLWHEVNWEPNRPYENDRMRFIVGLIGSRGLHSLMLSITHPWPGSAWDIGPTTRDWGAPKSSWFSKIALRYREDVADYRAALASNGMSEAENAVQFGNEPAAGHPGGNSNLARGTWSGHALWRELNKSTSYYGALQVIAPAYSMLDEAAAPTELSTSGVPGTLNWTGPVGRRAMHFRFYAPTLESASAYADAYATEMARRSEIVLARSWPKGTAAKEATRKDGIWVTEGYVVPGDSPASSAESWPLVLARVRAGIPGVRVYFAYRFYPEGGPDDLDWQIPIGGSSSETIFAP